MLKDFTPLPSKGLVMEVIAKLTEHRLEPEMNLSPDADLANRVRLYLAHAGHRPVRVLKVEVHDGIVTLRGRVPSYYIRQLAIACAQRVAGVRAVNDQIKASIPSSGQATCCSPIQNSF